MRILIEENSDAKVDLTTRGIVAEDLSLTRKFSTTLGRYVTEVSLASQQMTGSFLQEDGQD